jgi:hypothetical protein
MIINIIFSDNTYYKNNRGQECIGMALLASIRSLILIMDKDMLKVEDKLRVRVLVAGSVR